MTLGGDGALGSETAGAGGSAATGGLGELGGGASVGSGALTGSGIGGAAARIGGGAETPSACAVGTFRVAPERSVFGLPLTNAAGLPAIRMAIISRKLTAVEGRTRLATAANVSPGLTGP